MTEAGQSHTGLTRKELGIINRDDTGGDLTMEDDVPIKMETKQGTRMRKQVQSVYNRQVAKCLDDINDVFELPKVVEDRIKKAIEYACKDVDKLRLKLETRNGEQDEQDPDRYNR